MYVLPQAFVLSRIDMDTDRGTFKGAERHNRTGRAVGGHGRAWGGRCCTELGTGGVARSLGRAMLHGPRPEAQDGCNAPPLHRWPRFLEHASVGKIVQESRKYYWVVASCLKNLAAEYKAQARQRPPPGQQDPLVLACRARAARLAQTIDMDSAVLYRDHALDSGPIPQAGDTRTSLAGTHDADADKQEAAFEADPPARGGQELPG
jgi:hypothetical protein